MLRKPGRTSMGKLCMLEGVSIGDIHSSLQDLQGISCMPFCKHDCMLLHGKPLGPRMMAQQMQSVCEFVKLQQKAHKIADDTSTCLASSQVVKLLL